MKYKSAKSIQSGFIPVVILILVVAVGAGVVVTKKVVENPNVLGLSSFLLAQNDPEAPPPPPPGDGGNSAPPQQPQQQQQPPQNNAPVNNNPNPGTPQQENKPVNQQNPKPGIPQDNFRPLNPQNNNVGIQQNPKPGTLQNNPQEQQKFQQVQQQQWQQEASKFGFQIQNGPANAQGVALPSIQGNFNVGTVGGTAGGQQVNLNDGNTRFTFGSFKAVKADGSQFDIDRGAVEKINAAIKLQTGSEVFQDGNTFTVKRGDVSAKTDLPMSFNVATKMFTVQTATGEKEVKVLPDDAVVKLKEFRANFTANPDDMKISELNNEPVFEMPGTSQQKFLGFLPVGIQQTSVVSADDGNLVATNQSFISSILDIFSF